MDKVTSMIVDTANPKSVSSWARQRRWKKMVAAFPDIAHMRVLDLGGTPAFWNSAPLKPAHVTTVNLAKLDGFEGVDAIQGDACDPPPLNGPFDLVVSNSLIEHVGGHAQRMRLAKVIDEAAERHWVQTPYRYFPIEPHWMAPGIQFLPFAAKVRATMMWRLGHLHTTERAAAIESVHEIELLTLTQMRSYFPNSTIWCERVAGLVKSIVAIR